MAASLLNRSLGKVTEHIPGVRRIPVVRLLSAAEIALLAHDHYRRLTPDERHRLIALVRIGHGRPSNLTAAERAEVERLLVKLEPRRLFGDAADRLSPLPLPRRLLYGRRG